MSLRMILPDIRTVYGLDEIVTDYVRERFPDLDTKTPHTAIGVANFATNRLIAGVVYSMYLGHDIHMSIAADNPMWARPGVIGELLAYPFLQLGCVRATAITARGNTKARKLLEGVGFQLEGRLRHGYDGRQHAMIYGILATDAARWIERVKKHGEKRSEDARTA